jgi:hypothetical protein
MARQALLTRAQVAEQLAVSITQLERWAYERRELRPSYYLGRSPMYAQADVDRYLDSKRVAA